ncbi:MAG: DUF1223 domain-containing protein [Betaproteobacteria bacterium]|nr:MAG: DUF1223 domain-containing protein [Betaproteobacteria bacterium]
MNSSWPVMRLLTVAAAACLVCAQANAANTCSARSGPTIAPVVELYTSEGCNSCPPADRWLSALKSRPDVVGLAFHVDYWDRLGWKDRFASAEFTRRQSEQQSVNGARFSYTPQVVVDGHDRKDWPRANVGNERAKAPVSIELAHDGANVSAKIEAGPDAPLRLAAYWAVTEFGHRSAVKAGENEGVTLDHDYVVREYVPISAWTVQRGAAQKLSFTPSVAADPAHPRKVNLVVIDAASGRPLQALGLGC